MAATRLDIGDTTSRGGLLARALREHRTNPWSEPYDETLTVVSERAAASGSLTKADIGSRPLEEDECPNGLG